MLFLLREFPVTATHELLIVGLSHQVKPSYGLTLLPVIDRASSHLGRENTLALALHIVLQALQDLGVLAFSIRYLCLGIK